MSTTITQPAFTKIALQTAQGVVYRDVSTAPPRECLPEEVPVIDLSRMYGNLDERKALAVTIRDAAENTGFFYIKNHGIEEKVVQAAHAQAKNFFGLTDEEKEKVSRAKSQHFNGWHRRTAGRGASSTSRSNMEQFCWTYNPKYDPETKDLDAMPEKVRTSVSREEFMWDNTTQLPDYQQDCVRYWQENLQLARRLLRIFALGLDLPESFFDNVTTYPGSDSCFNYYPGICDETELSRSSKDIGLGAHTDLQCFTILWQDMSGGLQVLGADGQWVKTPPIAGTFVVNIGDYLMRLTNDRFKSTVHRVYSRSSRDRYSMPFFFGFNHSETCSVLPSCISEDIPAKYQPISCGDWIRTKLKMLADAPDA